MTFYVAPEQSGNDEKEAYSHRSSVLNARREYDASWGWRHFTGNQANVFGGGSDNGTVLHETLHFMGLSDRYKDWEWGEKSSLPHLGFGDRKGESKDIMANHRWRNLDGYLYRLYKLYGENGARIYGKDSFKMNRKIDITRDNSLKTPYEKGNRHVEIE